MKTRAWQQIACALDCATITLFSQAALRRKVVLRVPACFGVPQLHKQHITALLCLTVGYCVFMCVTVGCSHTMWSFYVASELGRRGGRGAQALHSNAGREAPAGLAL